MRDAASDTSRLFFKARIRVSIVDRERQTESSDTTRKKSNPDRRARPSSPVTDAADRLPRGLCVLWHPPQGGVVTPAGLGTTSHAHASPGDSSAPALRLRGWACRPARRASRHAVEEDESPVRGACMVPPPGTNASSFQTRRYKGPRRPSA